MNGLIASAKRIEEYGALLDCVKNTRLPIGMTGLSHIHKAHFAAALNADCGRPVLVITADEAQASRLALDMKTLGCRALLYPARDFAFRSTESQSREYEHRRLGVLDKMLRGEAQAVICSAEAASQLTLPPEELKNRTIELAVGDEMPLEDIVKALLRAGYSRSAQVDGVGQYAVRGGVLDFFTPGEEYPCRLELWGDEIDSMAYFDIETQRRTDNIEKIKITPSNEILPPDTDEFVELLERFRSEIHGKGAVKARECVDKDIDRIKGGLRLQSTDKYMPLLYDVASIFDYAKGYILCVSESFSVKERFNAAIGLMHEAMKAMFEGGELCPGLDRFSLHLSDLLNNYEQMGAIYMDNLPRGGFDTPVKELIGVNARQITAWNGSFSVLKDDLDALTDRNKRTCVIFAGTRKAADALRGDLIDDGYSALYMDELPNELAPGTLTVVPGCLSAGFEYPLAKITVFTHSGRAAVAQPKRNVRKSSNAFHSLDELHRGDYVVHVAHGIGIFEGINKLEASGTIKDYIKIRYDKGDILYVPVTQLDQVSKYIGPSGDDKPVRLNKLGGKAVGLSGVSGDIYHCHQRDEVHGYVGDIDYVDPKPIFAMLDAGYIPVIAPVGTDGQGHTFNINGDTAAGKLASALGAEKLVILTDIEGLCNDIKIRDVISYLNIEDVKALKDKGTIAGGMIPKVDCCVQAIEEGVTSVNIIDGRKPHSVLYEAFTNEGTGTTIGTAQPSVGIKW